MSVRTHPNTVLPTPQTDGPSGRYTLPVGISILGEYGTPESRAEYDRIIAEWLANGRTLPRSGSGNGSDVTTTSCFWRSSLGPSRTT